MKLYLRIAALLAAIAMGATLLGSCKITGAQDEELKKNYQTLDVSGMAPFTLSDHENNGRNGLDYEGYQSAYKSDKLEFLYHPMDGSVIVRENATGFMWTSMVDLKEKPLEKVEQKWRNYLSSLFIIEYYDLENNKGISANATPNDGSKITITPIENGFEGRYAFDKLAIELTIRIQMIDDRLVVNIPFDSIKEVGRYKLTAIEVLPMFGCAETRKEDGYVFYPDGAGAISRFTVENVREQEAIYEWKLYGEDDLNNYYNFIEGESSSLKVASMPVFGLREDKTHAFSCIISKGAADGHIKYMPGGYVVELNRIYSKFIYRRHIDLSILGSFASSKSTVSSKFEPDIQKKDVEVMYSFLTDEETANYSGMANEYRRYLLETNQLKDSIQPEDKMPLGLDIFNGIFEKRVISDKYMKMTTFEETVEMLKDTKEKTNLPIMTNLLGWQKGGYGEDPLPAEPEGKLGGKSELKKLAKYAKENGIDLSLNVNPVDLNGNVGGFNNRDETVYLPTDIPASYYNYISEVQQNEVFIRSLKSIFEKYLPKYTKLAKELGIGLSIERLGQFLYGNYNSSNLMQRNQSDAYIIENLKKITAEGVKIWSEGNSYMFSSTDKIMNLPYEHSLYDISNEAVPFYQIVVHGYIPYTSIPGNLFHDLKWMELKWAEFGYMPYFMVTKNRAEDLKYTKANWLFSSYYEQWAPVIQEISARMSERLSGVWDSTIRYHGAVQGQSDVFEIRYENGMTVYVNYTDHDVTVNGTAVPANDYVATPKQ